MKKILFCLIYFGYLLNASADENSFKVEKNLNLCFEDNPVLFIQNTANEICLQSTGVAEAILLDEPMIDSNIHSWGYPRSPIPCSAIKNVIIEAEFKCRHAQ